MNSFWDNVASELDYLGMTNKALAEKVGITASNIGKGQKQGSSPSAETAVKIAKVLGVSVEYLVTGNKTAQKNSVQEAEVAIHLYKKYKNLIENCEKTSSENVRLLEEVSRVFTKNDS